MITKYTFLFKALTACLFTAIGCLAQPGDTMPLTKVGTVGRMSSMLFPSCTILPNLSPTAGTKGWWNQGVLQLLLRFKRCLHGWLLWPDDRDSECPWHSTIDKIPVMILCFLSGITKVALWACCCLSFLLSQ